MLPIEFVRKYAVERIAGSRQERITAEAVRSELEKACQKAGERAADVKAAAETFAFRSPRFTRWAAEGKLPAGEAAYAAFDGSGFPEPVSSVNVSAIIPGKRIPAEIISFSAHIDAVPGSPGAYDNLSAVAILLETFRTFLRNRPDRTMVFLFCGAEEPGLCGSRAFVRAHRDIAAASRFHINVDLAGQKGGTDVLGVTGEAPVCRMLQDMLGEKGFPVETRNQVWSSDSNSFAQAGIPAMTLDRDGIGMHTPEDKAERICPEVLFYQARLISTIAAFLDAHETFPFPRAIPEAMRAELTEQFEDSGVEITA